MTDYTYEDREGDRLRIQPVETGPNEGTYIVTNNGIGVYVPADEAPKAAQAILDAAGVKGVVLTDLPEVEVKALLGAKADTDAFAGLRKAVAEAGVKAAAVKKAHDDLRTSPIALKALALYNRGLIGVGPSESWDATLDGDGVGEWTVRHFIRLAEKEEAKEKEAAEKLAARRDQLVRNHALGLDAYCYDDLDVNGKYLVDRLRIALDEGKDAK